MTRARTRTIATTNPDPGPAPHLVPFPHRGVLAGTTRFLLTACLAAVSVAIVQASARRPDDAPPAAKAPGASASQQILVDGRPYLAAKPWFLSLGYTPVAGDSDPAMRLALRGPEGRVELRADSREIEFAGRRVFLGDAILARAGTLYLSRIDAERALVPLLRPDRLPSRPPLRTVVLDAGHGGQDSGTVNTTLRLQEKDFALDVALRLRRQLAGTGWKVVLTRDEDRFVPLRERAEIANRANADVLVSIHFNAVAGNSTVRGTETFVLTPRHQRSTSSALASPDDDAEQPGNAHDHWSQVLGWQLHRRLLTKLGTEDRGLKRARFAVLRYADCPAVLVEAGYLSNDSEARRIADAKFRGDIAEALAAGLQAYAAMLDTPRSDPSRP